MDFFVYFGVIINLLPLSGLTAALFRTIVRLGSLLHHNASGLWNQILEQMAASQRRSPTHPDKGRMISLVWVFRWVAYDHSQWGMGIAWHTILALVVAAIMLTFLEIIDFFERLIPEQRGGPFLLLLLVVVVAVVLKLLLLSSMVRWLWVDQPNLPVPVNVCERKSSGLQPRTTALTDWMYYYWDIAWLF